MPKQPLQKGPRAEELLRSYFLDLGYFVVRGIIFAFQEFDITDIDLWLYMRPSPLTRERLLVDIKSKRTPQAIERIFWAKGLQIALGLDGSIVATTDKRPAVRDFGLRNNVTVLDGTFISRLESQRPPLNERLSEEEFLASLSSDSLAKLRGDWITKLRQSKSRLLSNLDFTGCNTWLADASYFVEQSIVDSQRRMPATRLLYLNISYFLIALDYILKDLSFVDTSIKMKALKDGFIYGTTGRQGIDQLLSQAVTLIENYLPDGKKRSDVLRRGILADFENVPADVLKEFFGKGEVSRSIFGYARKFEELAYSRKFIPPWALDNDLKSVLGVVLDFSQTERRRFFEAFGESSS